MGRKCFFFVGFVGGVSFYFEKEIEVALICGMVCVHFIWAESILFDVLEFGLVDLKRNDRCFVYLWHLRYFPPLIFVPLKKIKIR